MLITSPVGSENVYQCLLFCVIAVLDDEDSNNITAGSIVTVTVTLTRKRMAVSMHV